MEKYRNVDIVRALVKGKKFIIIFTAIIAITAIVYSLVTPKYWKSSTSFVVNSSSSGLGLGLSLPGNLSSLVGNSSLGNLLGASAEETDFLNIINSRTFNENLIRKFDLLTYLDIPQEDSLKAMDIAIEGIGEMINTSYNEKSKLIRISVETKDKQLSLDMCRYIREKSVLLKKLKDKKQQETEFDFFEQRMAEYNQRLSQELLSLKKFQEQNNVLELEQQAKAIIENYGEIISKISTLSIQADVLSSLYGADCLELKTIIMQRDLLKKEISNLESITGKNENKYIIGLDSIPDIANQYASLLVKKEILEKTIKSFYPIYEASRFKSIKESSLITVLDEPRLAGLRTKPKRALIVIISTFLGFFFSAVLTFFWNSKTNSEKEEWISLWKMFWGKK